MSNERVRFSVAAIICLSGGWVLVSGYIKSRPPKTHIAAVEVEVTQEVLDTLEESRFVELKRDSRADTIGEVESAIIKQARNIQRVRDLGDQSVLDLAAAFTERVSSMYWPDFERDFSASQRRGDPTPREDAKGMYDQRAVYLETQDWGPRVVMEGVGVSVIQISVDGELNIRRARFDAGFGVLVGKRNMNQYPVPNDPVESGYVSVEIVMPMYQYEVKSESMKPAVVGYHFAWDTKMRKWVPYESVLFKAPGLIFGAPAL
ncbi:MAG: hypothetical protein JKX70_04445 [Phycisphaerales bacterium]|nr:hypothetical protein [Phycisphaerales bacterium]